MIFRIQVRRKINLIYTATVKSNLVKHVLMDQLQVLGPVKAFAYALLVGNHHNFSKQGVEVLKRVKNAVKKFKFHPMFYIVVLQLFIDHAIAIQKQGPALIYI